MRSSPQPFGKTNAIGTELAGELLRSSEILRLRAIGRSMLPRVWPGDTLLIERANSGEVSEGDIVLFTRNQRLVAHRVVKSNLPGGSIQTQGDSTPRPDSPVSDRDLMGRVSCIIRNGKRIEPSTSLCFSERAVAALVRSSDIAARVFVGVHGMRRALQNQN